MTLKNPAIYCIFSTKLPIFHHHWKVLVGDLSFCLLGDCVSNFVQVHTPILFIGGYQDIDTPLL